MLCKYCGNQMDSNSKFCPACGKSTNDTLVALINNAKPNSLLKGVLIVLAIVFLVSAITLPFVYFSNSHIGNPDCEKLLLKDIYFNSIDEGSLNSSCSTFFVFLVFFVLFGAAFSLLNKYKYAIFAYVGKLVSLIVFLSSITNTFVKLTDGVWNPENPTAPGGGFVICIIICIVEIVLSIYQFKKQNLNNK